MDALLLEELKACIIVSSDQLLLMFAFFIFTFCKGNMNRNNISFCYNMNGTNRHLLTEFGAALLLVNLVAY